MEQRIKEAVRYLGFGKHAVDDQTMSLIYSSFSELEKIVNARSVYRIFKLEFREDNCIEIGKLQIKSKSLSQNLYGCTQAVLFGATLGTEADRMMKKCSVVNMASAVVLQACAAALLEEYCDKCQKEIEYRMLREEKFIRPRFSPGYGDFSIDHQKMILCMLDAYKKIGLTITNGSMLVPTKSITAVIGVSRTKKEKIKTECNNCNKKDCLYKRSN